MNRKSASWDMKRKREEENFEGEEEGRRRKRQNLAGREQQREKRRERLRMNV